MAGKKYTGVCCFCGYEGKLSKEHIFPNWIGNILNRNQQKRIETYFPIGESIDEKQPVFNKQSGAIHTKKIAKVCNTCNNTWMSEIVSNAKSIELKLLKGEFKNNLDSVSKVNLLNNITLIALNIDKATIDLVIDDSHRKQFKENKSLSFVDFVYIYYLEDVDTDSPNMFSASGKPRIDLPQEKDGQNLAVKIIVYHFGNLGVLVVLSEFHATYSMLSETSKDFLSKGFKLYHSLENSLQEEFEEVRAVNRMEFYNGVKLLVKDIQAFYNPPQHIYNPWH